MPRVSVVLPFLNRAATLERCVRSVLAQTFADLELIAVDDGSSDGSAEAIAKLGDSRVRLLRHERNAGPSAARNTAIRAATGELMALIDSDDEWLPEKLERQIALLDTSGCGLCGCEYFVIDETGERRQRLPEPLSWREELHLRCELGNGSTLLIRRRCVEDVGLLDESLRLYEDWDWVLRMLAAHELRIVHEPLARVHVGAPRSTELFARSARLFLAKHDHVFSQLGAAHRRRVRGKHWESVAASAFANRKHAAGCAYLLKSFMENPLQDPVRLGALMLAPLDAVLGTSLITRAAARRRKSSLGP